MGTAMAPKNTSTLIRPPPDDPEKSPIENVLELTPLSVIDPVCNLALFDAIVLVMESRLTLT